MTIEAKLDRTNELLEQLVDAMSHIGAAAAPTAGKTKETLADVAGGKTPPKKTPPKTEGDDEPTETAAEKKKRLAAEKKEAAAKKKAEAAAAKKKKEEAAKAGEEVPDPADVGGVQAFKKTIIGIGRESGETGYAQKIKDTLAEEGYAHSEKVPAEEYDHIIEVITAAFAPESGDEDEDI